MIGKWIYRILAPGHPRGWIDIDVVSEGGEEMDSWWVHSHGMERWELPNLEIVGVPGPMTGYSHGILYELLGYMKAEGRAFEADDSVGGRLVSSRQPAYHLMSIREVDHTVGSEVRRALRIVDLHEEEDSGFPRRLFAAHLCALAYLEEEPKERAALYRRAVKLSTEEFVPVSGSLETFDASENVNNYLAWLGLADALACLGDMENAVDAGSRAVISYPAAMRHRAAEWRTGIERGTGSRDDPAVPLWSHIEAFALAAMDPTEDQIV